MAKEDFGIKVKNQFTCNRKGKHSTPRKGPVPKNQPQVMKKVLIATAPKKRRSFAEQELDLNEMYINA